MVSFADDPRLLILPAEEVFDLAAILRVVENVADCCRALLERFEQTGLNRVLENEQAREPGARFN